MTKLTTEQRNALHEHVFAFPKRREEPLVSNSHVKDAIARFDQVKDVSNKARDQAWKRVQTAAKKFNVEVHEKDWRELFTRNGRAVPHD